MTGSSGQFPVVARGLRHQLEIGGLSWSRLVRRASEIVLFGSRAQGVGGDDSDWDLLCIGDDATSRVGAVHLVWLSPDDTVRGSWLGSELAGHVAAYGVWLRGASGWKEKVFVSPSTLAHKRRLVKAGLRALESHHRDLAPPRRHHHALRIRRDVQRLLILGSGEAVPASPVLDQAWAASISRDQWTAVCASLEFDKPTADLTWRIVSAVTAPSDPASTESELLSRR